MAFGHAFGSYVVVGKGPAVAAEVRRIFFVSRMTVERWEKGEIGRTENQVEMIP